MGFLVYKEHTIVASAAGDEITGKYCPLASITWRTADDKRGIHLLINSLERCTTYDEANTVALEAAKAWVDRSLGHLD